MVACGWVQCKVERSDGVVLQERRQGKGHKGDCFSDVCMGIERRGWRYGRDQPLAREKIEESCRLKALNAL